jgi:NTE family protein
MSDGGVYDSLGVNPLMRSRNALDYVIVSDAGKPFDFFLARMPLEELGVSLAEAPQLPPELSAGADL